MESKKDIKLEKFNVSKVGLWKMQMDNYMYQKDLHLLLKGEKPAEMKKKD